MDDNASLDSKSEQNSAAVDRLWLKIYTDHKIITKKCLTYQQACISLSRVAMYSVVHFLALVLQNTIIFSNI